MRARSRAPVLRPASAVAQRPGVPSCRGRSGLRCPNCSALVSPDAEWCASGLAPVVSARALPWASAAFVVVAPIVATIVALPATPGR